MKAIYILSVLTLFMVTSCNNKSVSNKIEEQEEIKNSFTIFSEKFQLFGEADPFVVNKESEVLAHFTHLNNFKPIKNGTVKLVIEINGKQTLQVLNKPLRDGIYKFMISPKNIGKGKMYFDIDQGVDVHRIYVKNIEVFPNADLANQKAKENNQEDSNDITYLLEQIWVTDFNMIKIEPKKFDEIINTSGKIVPASTNQINIIAQSSGIVKTKDDLVQGKKVEKGEAIVYLNGEAVENSYNVKLKKAEADYNRTKANYQRLKELKTDYIVSLKEFQEAKNEFEKAKVEFLNLNKNLSKKGKAVLAPYSGVLTKIRVKEGEYVKSGAVIATITLKKAILLKVNLPKKYANRINLIKDANFKVDYLNKIFSVKQLGGVRVNSSIASNSESPYIPIYFKLPASKELINFSYADVYLKANQDKEVLYIPKTAIIESENSFWVYVQTAGESYQKRDVKLGVTDGENWTIKQGLKQGDYVVTKGAFGIKQASMSGKVPEHTH